MVLLRLFGRLRLGYLSGMERMLFGNLGISDWRGLLLGMCRLLCQDSQSLIKRRAKEERPCHVLVSEGYSVFCYDRFSGTCMRCYEDAVTLLQVVYGAFLECVEFEWVL